jgi:hypothetical protein
MKGIKESSTDYEIEYIKPNEDLVKMMRSIIEMNRQALNMIQEMNKPLTFFKGKTDE